MGGPAGHEHRVSAGQGSHLERTPRGLTGLQVTPGWEWGWCWREMENLDKGPFKQEYDMISSLLACGRSASKIRTGGPQAHIWESLEPQGLPGGSAAKSRPSQVMKSRPAPGQARSRSREVCEQPGCGLHGHGLLVQTPRPKSAVFALDPCKCHFRGHLIICIRNQRTQASGKETTWKTAVLLRTAPGGDTRLWVAEWPRDDDAPSCRVTRRTETRDKPARARPLCHLQHRSDQLLEAERSTWPECTGPAAEETPGRVPHSSTCSYRAIPSGCGTNRSTGSQTREPRPAGKAPRSSRTGVAAPQAHRHAAGSRKGSPQSTGRPRQRI